MRITEYCVRIFSSNSKYGDEPRTIPTDSPIVIQNFPQTKETVSIYFGAPPEWIAKANKLSRVIGILALKSTFQNLNYNKDELDKHVQKEMSDLELSDEVLWPHNWYITIILQRETLLGEDRIANSPYFWIEPKYMIEDGSKFANYSRKHINLAATLVLRRLNPIFFETLHTNDRVYFSSDQYDPITMPEFSTGNASISIESPISQVDARKIKQDIENIRIRLNMNKDMDFERVIELYWAFQQERDSMKKFLWGFFAIEVLTNKLYEKLRGKITSNLVLSVNRDGVTSTVAVPNSLILKPDNQGFPLETKFSILALAFNPNGAVDDVADFSSANQARNNLAHRGEINTSGLPTNKVEKLLKIYINALLDYMAS
jgi:hypothetical protein